MASTVFFGVAAGAPLSAQSLSSVSRLAAHSQAQPARLGSLRLRAVPEKEYVAYDGDQSVFPAEACDELGGEHCDVDGVGAEVKPKPGGAAPAGSRSHLKVKHREYLDYRRQSKTVFPGEACDELGGEFCEPDYQAGVFQERK